MGPLAAGSQTQPAGRKVTIDEMNSTPTKIVPDYKIWAATHPNANDSFCFFSRGNR